MKNKEASVSKSKKINETKDFYPKLPRCLTAVDLSVDFFFTPALYHLSSASNRKQNPKHTCTSGLFSLTSHLLKKEYNLIMETVGDENCMQVKKVSHPWKSNHFGSIPVKF